MGAEMGRGRVRAMGGPRVLGMVLQRKTAGRISVSWAPKVSEISAESKRQVQRKVAGWAGMSWAQALLAQGLLEGRGVAIVSP